MFLAFKLRDLITVPFGWLMGWLYQVTGNYGVSMILFAVCGRSIGSKKAVSCPGGTSLWWPAAALWTQPSPN